MNLLHSSHLSTRRAVIRQGRIHGAFWAIGTPPFSSLVSAITTCPTVLPRHFPARVRYSTMLRWSWLAHTRKCARVRAGVKPFFFAIGGSLTGAVMLGDKSAIRLKALCSVNVHEDTALDAAQQSAVQCTVAVCLTTVLCPVHSNLVTWKRIRALTLHPYPHPHQ